MRCRPPRPRAHAASARALLFALALDAEAATRERQRRFIETQLGAELARSIEALQGPVDALEPEQRLPALLRTLPALRQAPREERMKLMAVLNGMSQREARASPMSYALRKLAQVHLRDQIAPVVRGRELPLSEVQTEAQLLLSVLSHYGQPDETIARRAYEIGAHHLYPRERPPYQTPGAWPAPLDAALTRLDRLAPLMKEQLVEAMVKTIMHDRQLTVGEAELLRAVCATLHCPLPPLAAGRA